MLQYNANRAESIIPTLREKALENGKELSAEVLSIADKNVGTSAREAVQFREEMQQLGLAFPLRLFRGNPCPLADGSALSYGMLISMLSFPRRYDLIDSFRQYLWDISFLLERTDVLDPQNDLKEISCHWSDPKTTAKSCGTVFGWP